MDRRRRDRGIVSRAGLLATAYRPARSDGACTRLWPDRYGKPRDRLLLWIGLAACSALFELLQDLSPGRSPAVIDSLASIAGLTAGFVAGAALQTQATGRLD